MKKVTIITPPEYELQIVEAIGNTGVTQFKLVTGSEYEALKGTEKQQFDWNNLYSKIHTRLEEIEKLGGFQIKPTKPDAEELKRFTHDPNVIINKSIEDLNSLMVKLKDKNEEKFIAGNKLVQELQTKITQKNKDYEDLKAKKESVQVKLVSVQALEPEELKKCFAVGVVKKDILPQMEEYLKRYPDTFSKAIKFSEDEFFLFVFSTEEHRQWVESLFMVFNVRDIFDVLDPNDILLVLDSTKRQEAIKKYREELRKLEEKNAGNVEGDKVKSILEDYNNEIEKIKSEYDIKIKENDEKYAKEIESLKQTQIESLGKFAYYDHLLSSYSGNRVKALRGNVISVLQGYTPEAKIAELMTAIEEVEKEVGEKFFIQVEEPSESEIKVPSTPMYFKPAFLQPLWTLTTLRGWPAFNELNPGYVSILIFCLQFGLMFGDVGQGLIILLIGIVLSRKYKTGMMSKIGTLFLPMGITAMIFGVLYDSIFLMEGILFHHHPILPSPSINTLGLMDLIFTLAAIEVIFGLILSMINQIKKKNWAGLIGEHGLGMVLYVYAIYSAVGPGFSPNIGSTTINFMLAGLGLSFIEPILHGLLSGHGFGIESIGEGFGGMLMTFVEGLANLFSFLRIAAFALAHASLGEAAITLGGALGQPIIGYFVMNLLALSFELVSSSVQSLRLLYYEFMGKFFVGGGEAFKPFTTSKKI
jgi:vacuolar-type H+-ATPase subunit I/STV1